MARSTSQKYKSQMIRQSNKLNKIAETLKELSYKMKKENPYPLSTDEVYSYMCQEAADMIDNVCKHLTNNGTIY